MRIHVHLQPPGVPDHWMGRFSNIIRLAASDDGVLKGLRDFRVDPVLAERNKV